MVAPGTDAIYYYATQLCNALADRDRVDVTLVAPERADPGLLDDGVRAELVPVGTTMADAVRNTVVPTRARAFVRAVRRSDPDVLHVQNCYNLWIASFLPLFRDRTVVTTLHDVEPHLGFERADKTLARRLHLRFSDGYVVQCEAEREKFRRFDVEGPDFAIPHGDYEFFTDYRDPDVETEDAVLFFGNIAPYKGLEYLLRVAPALERRLPGTELVVAGRGDVDRHADLLARVDNLTLRNEFVPKEEVAALFQRARVVALPYVEATQSGIIPVAYAFETPVVATRVGCIPEVVDDGETGVLVPPRDEDALLEGLERVLADEARAERMGANAYEKMQTDLSWGSIAGQTVEAYETVLAEGG